MLDGSIQTLTSWLHANPHWATAITFIISLSESLAIVGTIIPGSVTMTAIGVLVGAGIISAPMTFIAAILGAIAGDGLSYWLGAYYHQGIKRLWPFNRYPAILENGEAFFERHGGKSVFIGRFTGPIRSIIPVVAGMMQMPSGRFFIANASSAIAWSFAYLAPGILLGAAAVELSAEDAGKLILLIFAILIALWLISWLIHWVSWHLLSFIDTKLRQAWQFLRRHASVAWITRLLQNPAQPDKHGQLVIATAFVVLLTATVCLALNVKSHGLLTHLNEPLYYFLRSLRNNTLDNIALLTTFLAEKSVLLILFVTMTLWLIRQKQWRLALHWLANGALALTLITLAKHWIAYPRPTGNIVTRTLYAFPSGHTTLLVALIGFFAYIIVSHTDIRRRRWVYLPAVIVCLLVGLSRLYLGAHWFTDILGAFGIGLCCVFMAVLSYQRQLPNKPNGFLTALLGCLTLLIAWSVYTNTQYEQQRTAYQPARSRQTITHAAWWNAPTSQLPSHRLNRFGHPVAMMNLQWADTLSHIQAHFVKAGWEVAPPSTWISFLSRLISDDKAHQLPAFTQLHRLHPPALTLTKAINHEKPLVVLRLWDSGAHFSDKNTPLWIGSVHYRILWRNRKQLANLPEMQTLLAPVFNSYQVQALKSQEGNVYYKLQTKQT